MCELLSFRKRLKKNDDEKSQPNPNPVLTICKISQICQIAYEITNISGLVKILHDSYYSPFKSGFTEKKKKKIRPDTHVFLVCGLIIWGFISFLFY